VKERKNRGGEGERGRGEEKDEEGKEL